MTNDGLGKDSGGHARKIASERFPESEEQNEKFCAGIPNKITSEHISTKVSGRATHIPLSVITPVMVGTIPVWLPREMTNQRFPGSEEQVVQVSAGIPDKITLEHIGTKFLGRSIHIPSSVSTLMIVGTIPVWLPKEMTNERFPKSEEQVQDLLPGIPDDVTLDHICTKLPWRAIDILLLVSRAWRQAIRSHRVYDTRVQSQSLETLLVHSHSSPHSSRNGDCEVLCLYSLREECCYELPGIPGLDRGIPRSCQWISLDGKIYVLGGMVRENYTLSGAEVYKEVYVLDLAVHRHWKQCAHMQQGRHSFGCGVLDGKIYAFGGVDYGRLVNSSEVYDPKTNAWSRIMPMKHFRFGHRVSIQGEEIVVHGGQFQSSDYPLLSSRGVSVSLFSLDANFLDIYHPGKDEWRVVGPFGHRCSESVFMAEGKFYLMTPVGIYVHDTTNNTWEDLHSNAYARFGSIDTAIMVPSPPVVINDELLLKMSLKREIENPWRTKSSVDFLMKSKGFGSEDGEIVWHLMRDCGNKLRSLGDFMCPIQL